ncbi:MAG TPA: NB-ARC domain-containing protein [Pyrinomonadaceae bacterium]|jgi:hypothetical protein
MAESPKQYNALLYLSLPLMFIGYATSIFSPENADKTLWFPALLNFINLAQNVGVEFFGGEFPQWCNSLRGKFNELDLLENANLRKAIKKAVSNIIEIEIPQISDEEQQNALKKITQIENSTWDLVQILQAENFDVVSFDEVSKLFSATEIDFSKLKSPITQNAWKKLLLWLSLRNSDKLTDETLNQISERLVEKFPLALKDAFLSDFKEEGKAFAELLLSEVSNIKGLQVDILTITKQIETFQREQGITLNQVKISVGKIEDYVEKQIKASENNEIEGFTKIDLEFLNTQQNLTTGFTPVNFYLANYHAQWWGILNNLDEKISIFSRAKSEINANLYGNCPIVAFFKGSGGVGKTTLARQLVVDFIKIEKKYDCLWIDCQNFNDEENLAITRLDTILESRNPTICVIDDWGKLNYQIQEKFKRFFGKLNREGGALKFIITDRQFDSRINRAFLISNPSSFDNRYELKADNNAILQKVFATLGRKYQDLSERLFTQSELSVAKPFFLLYVLMRVGNNEELLQQLSLSSKSAESYFKEIVQYDLSMLYRNSERKGFVTALGFLAYLQKTHQANISKNSFLTLANEFSETNPNFSLKKVYQDKIVENWEIIGQYLFAEKSLFARRDDSPELLSFNKDDFIEAILQAYVFENYNTVAEYTDEYKATIAEFIIEKGSQTSSSYLAFYFCSRENTLAVKAANIVQKLLDTENSHHAYTKIFLYSQYNFSHEQIWEWVKQYLSFASNNNFFQIYCVLWLNRIFANNKPQLLLKLTELNNLGALSRHVIIPKLKALDKHERTQLAKDLLENSKEPEVISSCLEILKDDVKTDEELKEKVKDLLEK